MTTNTTTCSPELHARINDVRDQIENDRTVWAGLAAVRDIETAFQAECGHLSDEARDEARVACGYDALLDIFQDIGEAAGIIGPNATEQRIAAAHPEWNLW